MLTGPAARVRAAVLLWQRGVWDALQLQRCVVYFVLDESGQVLAQTTRCAVTNGVVYLGSLLLFSRVTQPAMDWLLQQYATPTYGPATVAAWQQLLAGVFQLLWLLPVYLISLMVSCTRYQQVAKATFEVQAKQQYLKQLEAEADMLKAVPGAGPGPAAATPMQQQQPTAQQQQHLSAHPSQPQQSRAAGRQPSIPVSSAATAAGGTVAAAAAGQGGGMMRVLEGTAQEVYRALLFVVFTIEVYVMSLVPFAGVVLNVLFLSWLYAYYCFDYKWALEGIRLPNRLHFFECNWAYFAGFGFPCVVATIFWPFHVGAALANLLFPVFIMVACGAKPVEAKSAVLGAAYGSQEAPVGSLPVFKLALRPTYWLVRKVFARFTTASAGAAAGSSNRPRVGLAQ